MDKRNICCHYTSSYIMTTNIFFYTRRCIMTTNISVIKEDVSRKYLLSLYKRVHNDNKYFRNT